MNLESNTAAKLKKDAYGRVQSSKQINRWAINTQPFAKACQACTDNFYFWIVVAVFALFEPLLCSKYPTPLLMHIQYTVLGVSTVLYVIQLIGVASREWEAIHDMQLGLEDNAFSVAPSHGAKILKLFIFLMNEEEYFFEMMCLTMGWALIYPYPGIAALRCFRVFRLLWFCEVKVFKAAALVHLNPIFGKAFVKRVFNVFNFAIKAITALIDEMLRVGHRTRGGIILILMLFYTSYVMGIALFVETRGESPYCSSVSKCIFSLVRLTFFDGDGFDFAAYLTKDHRALFCLVIFYLLLTSFGILNGLVGIFGNVFANASEEAFGARRENGDFDDYDDDDGPPNSNNGQSEQASPDANIAKNASLEEDEDGDGDVVPFESSSSLNVPSIKGSKVAPSSALAGVRDKIANTSPPKPKPAIHQPTYAELKYLLDVRRHARKNVDSMPKGGDAGDLYKAESVESRVNMFAIGSMKRAKSNRNIGGNASHGNSTAQMDAGVARSIQEELQQLRVDMKIMMKMQVALQKQLSRLADEDDGDLKDLDT